MGDYYHCCLTLFDTKHPNKANKHYFTVTSLTDRKLSIISYIHPFCLIATTSLLPDFLISSHPAFRLFGASATLYATLAQGYQHARTSLNKKTLELASEVASRAPSVSYYDHNKVKPFSYHVRCCSISQNPRSLT